MKRFLQAQFYVVVLVLASVFSVNTVKAGVIDYEVKNEGPTVKVTLRKIAAEHISSVTLQRCATGNAFQDLLTISSEALGEKEGYTFIDVSPYYSNNFYRLRIETVDGAVWFSDIKYTRNLEVTVKAQFFPNPSNGNTVYLKLDACKASEQIKVTIYSKLGAKLIEYIVEQNQTTDAPVQLDIVRDLRPDIYHIQVETAGRIFREKLIIT